MSSLRPPPLMVPAEGPEHPIFARVDAEDSVEATLLFGGPLGDARLDAAERALRSWFASARWGDVGPQLTDETLTPSCLHIAVTRASSAREPFAALLGAMAGAHVPVRRALFARLRRDGDPHALLRALDPAARPHARYDAPAAWWRACFDLDLAPPLSEDRTSLAADDNAIVEAPRTTFVERRAMPLHVPGVRICHGLAEAVFVDDSTLHVARVREATSALHEALRTRFGAAVEPDAWPVPYNRHKDALVDPILSSGRPGFSCAFHAGALRELLQEPLFRYREDELMRAAADTVAALRLAPVICWRRFTGRYVLQLWERALVVP